jgi:hypothetical protein
MPQRYVLCRPQGGLNDVLCQVELCRRYAAQHGRTLVVDTQAAAESCLPVPFEELFVLDPAIGSVRAGFGRRDGLLAQLDRPGISVSPAALARNLNRRVSRHAARCRVPEPRTPDMPQDVVVHMDSGGGNISHDLIAGRHLRVNPALLRASAVWRAAEAERAAWPDYVAVHVRHTDIVTPDYEARLRAIFDAEQRKGSGASPVLVCSDSAEVMATARTLAAQRNHLRLLQPASRLRGSARRPVHIAAPRMTPPGCRAYVAELLADLYLLSGAATLHLMAPSGRAGPAGFSRLARFLQQHPDARSFFFSLDENAAQ